MNYEKQLFLITLNYSLHTLKQRLTHETHINSTLNTIALSQTVSESRSEPFLIKNSRYNSETYSMKIERFSFHWQLTLRENYLIYRDVRAYFSSVLLTEGCFTHGVMSPRCNQIAVILVIGQMPVTINYRNRIFGWQKIPNGSFLKRKLRSFLGTICSKIVTNTWRVTNR